jgi:hypothetical protein
MPLIVVPRPIFKAVLIMSIIVLGTKAQVNITLVLSRAALHELEEKYIDWI